MHILIIGAAGMVGRKLTAALVKAGRSWAASRSSASRWPMWSRPSRRLDFPARSRRSPPTCRRRALPRALVAKRPDLIFHLAAIVSGEAEADFEKGYRINLDGTRYLLEAIRLEGMKAPYKPRLVFTSSIAVFGAPFPEAIGDEFFSTPLTSYGTQKAICELLLNDYSRKGFVDGVGIRLPTIVDAPGQAQRCGLGLLLQHPARAAGRAGGRAAGQPRMCATGSPARAPRSAS